MGTFVEIGSKARKTVCKYENCLPVGYDFLGSIAGSTSGLNQLLGKQFLVDIWRRFNLMEGDKGI